MSRDRILGVLIYALSERCDQLMDRQAVGILRDLELAGFSVVPTSDLDGGQEPDDPRRAKASLPKPPDADHPSGKPEGAPVELVDRAAPSRPLFMSDVTRNIALSVTRASATLRASGADRGVHTVYVGAEEWAELRSEYPEPEYHLPGWHVEICGAHVKPLTDIPSDEFSRTVVEGLHIIWDGRRG